jgi:hypothetical protein
MENKYTYMILHGHVKKIKNVIFTWGRGCHNVL